MSTDIRGHEALLHQRPRVVVFCLFGSVSVGTLHWQLLALFCMCACRDAVVSLLPSALIVSLCAVGVRLGRLPHKLQLQALVYDNLPLEEGARSVDSTHMYGDLGKRR